MNREIAHYVVIIKHNMTNYYPKKKHLETIAGILREAQTDAYKRGGVAGRIIVECIRKDLSDYFSTTNPDFDPKRFREMVEGEEIIHTPNCRRGTDKNNHFFCIKQKRQ